MSNARAWCGRGNLQMVVNIQDLPKPDQVELMRYLMEVTGTSQAIFDATRNKDGAASYVSFDEINKAINKAWDKFRVVQP